MSLHVGLCQRVKCHRRFEDIHVKIKVKFALQQTMKALRVTRGIVLLFKLGARCRWLVNLKPRAALPLERDPLYRRLSGGPRARLDG